MSAGYMRAPAPTLSPICTVSSASAFAASRSLSWSDTWTSATAPRGLPPSRGSITRSEAIKQLKWGFMRITTLLASLLLAHAAAAQTPLVDLAKPPPTALRFAIVSTAGKHGESSRWTTADGMRMGRESLVLRGQVFEVDSAAHAGADGMLDRVTVRGFTPNGDAAESFAITAGRATWKSPVDGTSVAYTGPALYVAFGGPIDLTADLAERLIASPDKSLALLPAGRASAELLAKATVGEG